MIPVPFVEYLNVRIRVHHSRLFTRDMYEDLLSGDSLAAITTFFLNHPDYSIDVERALETLPEREGLERGVTNNFARCISDILNMSDGRMLELFKIVLYSFDLKNLRTIILGYSNDLPFHKVRDMIIPCGSLDLDALSVMHDAPDLHGLVQFLSGRYPIGAEALKNALKDTTENEPVLNLINRVDMNFYRQILNHLDQKDNNIKIIRDILRFEIDMKNITSALKFVWEGAKPGMSNGKTFTMGGNINTRLLYEISGATALDEAFEMIESTPFHSAVEKGIIYYAETGFLHEMERFFEEVFIRKTQLYKRFHPFGIGVFLGYVWGKFIEMTNLRTIINGIAFKTGAGQIRKGLIYV